MKFADFKTAAFAETAFAAAGLDLKAAVAANNADVIKSAIAANAAKAGDAELPDVLKEAVAENKAMTAELATLKANFANAQADAAKFTALSSALVTAGLPADAEKFGAALDAKVAKSAAAIVAKSGHAPIADEILTENAEKKKKTETAAADTNLKGRDRLAADFHKQHLAMWKAEHRSN